MLVDGTASAAAAARTWPQPLKQVTDRASLLQAAVDAARAEWKYGAENSWPHDTEHARLMQATYTAVYRLALATSTSFDRAWCAMQDRHMQLRTP